LLGIDNTKTGVFEDPFKPAYQNRGKIEEIRKQISFLASDGEPPSPIKRARRDIHANDLRSLGRGRYGADVVSRTATRYKYVTAQRTVVRNPFQKWRCRRTFFPWRITRPVSLFPIHLGISTI
jgi:hypothetical protein